MAGVPRSCYTEDMAAVCPECRKETIEDIGRCQHCNAELPRGLLRWLWKIFAPAGNAAPKAGRDGGLPASEYAAPAPGAFRMEVQEVFDIAGRGVVVTGDVERGEVSVGDTVGFEDEGGRWTACRVGAVQKAPGLGSSLDSKAVVGETVGLLLQGIDKGDLPSEAVLEKR